MVPITRLVISKGCEGLCLLLIIIVSVLAAVEGLYGQNFLFDLLSAKSFAQRFPFKMTT